MAKQFRWWPKSCITWDQKNLSLRRWTTNLNCLAGFQPSVWKHPFGHTKTLYFPNTALSNFASVVLSAWRMAKLTATHNGRSIYVKHLTIVNKLLRGTIICGDYKSSIVVGGFHHPSEKRRKSTTGDSLLNQRGEHYKPCLKKKRLVPTNWVERSQLCQLHWYVLLTGSLLSLKWSSPNWEVSQGRLCPYFLHIGIGRAQSNNDLPKYCMEN